MTRKGFAPVVAGGLAMLVACGGAADGDGVERLAAAVREEITAEGLAAQAEAIVRHERPSGSVGENAAIDHIVETLRADGVEVEVHTFDAFTSDPLAARVEVPQTGFAPAAITAAFSAPADGLEAPLVDVGAARDLPEIEVATGEVLSLAGAIETHMARLRGGAGDAPASRSSGPGAQAPGRSGRGRAAGGTTAGAAATAETNLQELTGAIALVDGTPGPDEAWKLQQLGAAGAVFINPEERLNELITTTVWGTPSLRDAHRIPTLPVAQVRRGDGERIRGMLSARDGLRVRLTVEVDTRWRPLRLAVARIEAGAGEAGTAGTGAGGAAETPLVLLGGHIDAWYHGATDEGASNAAMLELARAFHRHRDELRRSLWVAWWPGHSNGRYAGSTWLADYYFGELERRAIAYLNVDGIGQTGARRFGASATSSLAGLAQRVVRDRVDQEVRAGRPGRNSDQAFNGIGLPLLQLNHSRLAEDGGYWWWHTPDDTFDKIDPQVLETDAELYADALAHLLAAPVPAIDAVAEIEALGEVLAERQATAGDALDLGEAQRLQAELLSAVQELSAAIADDPGAASAAGAELGLVAVLRPLHRVLYTLGSPYHPDPAVGLGALPGLAPVEILAAAEPDSDRYGFALATLVRERNRLLEALDEALASAEHLRGRLEDTR